MAKAKAAISFSEYFSQVYAERWPELETALQNGDSEVVSIAKAENETEQEAFATYQSLAIFSGKQEGLYQLDLASVLCTLGLPIKPGDCVLDLCAAPGGKSLCLMHRLDGDAEFSLNDVSESRLVRLKRVMKEHTDIYGSENLRFFKRDAGRWGQHEPESYDLVICDVPCSSEAHGKARAQNSRPWSLKASKALAVRQLAILCSGFDSLRSGGSLLYSTCSINPLENDQVIERFHKKRKDLFEIVGLELVHEQAEFTEFGQQLFPDSSGSGPIYFCQIKKR